jgi:hypothetical protein
LSDGLAIIVWLTVLGIVDGFIHITQRIEILFGAYFILPGGSLSVTMGIRHELRRKMNEQELIAIWNSKRSQIISSQYAPTFVLSVAFTLASLGIFKSASHSAQYFALGVVAATGILAAISTYAVTREAEAVVFELKKMKEISLVGKKIVESRELLVLNVIANFGVSIGIFALSVWAILN